MGELNSVLGASTRALLFHWLRCPAGHHGTFCHVLLAVSECVMVLQLSVLLGYRDSFKEHWSGFMQTVLSLNLSNGFHMVKRKGEA